MVSDHTSADPSRYKFSRIVLVNICQHVKNIHTCICMCLLVCVYNFRLYICMGFYVLYISIYVCKFANCLIGLLNELTCYHEFELKQFVCSTVVTVINKQVVPGYSLR